MSTRISLVWLISSAMRRCLPIPSVRDVRSINVNHCPVAMLRSPRWAPHVSRRSFYGAAFEGDVLSGLHPLDLGLRPHDGDFQVAPSAGSIGPMECQTRGANRRV